MRILVTGPTGAFGRHFVETCLARGQHVVTLPRDINLAFLGVEAANCLDSLKLDAVAHFAAKTPSSRENRSGSMTEVNVGATTALLGGLRKVAPKARFLYVGTDKEYGPHPTKPFYQETDLLNAQGMYATTKAAADALCLAYAREGLVPNAVVARVCNVIATGDSHARLIPATIQRLFRHEPAEVYDQPYMRQYIHVEDACDVLYRLITQDDPTKVAGQAFNIAADFNTHSQAEVVKDICSHFYDAKTITVPTPPGVDLAKYPPLHPGKIKRVLGWKAKHTFEDAIADAVAWWSNQKQLESIR